MKGPLLYKITCEKPLHINDTEELEAMYHRFINDHVRLGYLEATRKILESSIPTIIVDKINNTVEEVYDNDTTKALNKIKEDLNKYLISTYGEYLSFTIKEDNK